MDSNNSQVEARRSIFAPPEGDKDCVWLVYCFKGSQRVRKFLLPSEKAARMHDSMARSQRCSLLYIEGTRRAEPIKYTPVGAKPVSITSARVHALRESQYAYGNSSIKRERLSFTRMSFHADKLAKQTLLACEVTGICGFLDLPALPISLTYTHPLANERACRQLLKGISEARKLGQKTVLERQVWAGILLSLLQAKHLLRTDEETTATERNLVLQNAGSTTLATLCFTLARLWKNPLVWNRVPHLSLEWKTHAHADLHDGKTSVQEVLQRYNETLLATLEPAQMSKAEMQEFAAMKALVKEKREQNPRKGLVVYGAAAVQARNIKDTKTESREHFDLLKPHLSVVNRILVGKVLKDLLILPDKSKQQAAQALRDSFRGRGPLEEVAEKLARMIVSAQNDKLFEESFDRISKPRIRSIADILAEKRGQFND